MRIAAGRERTNQKARTKRAIVGACRDLMGDGSQPTMPEVRAGRRWCQKRPPTGTSRTFLPS